MGRVERIDKFVEARLSSLDDWDLNFKALKKKRKDSERIPDTQRVGCFNVSLVPLKTIIEDHIHRLTEALLTSLRNSALADLQTVDAYINTSMQRLTNLPNSPETMGQAKKDWKVISDQKSEMARVKKQVEEKNTLLKQTAGIQPLDLRQLNPRWETFVDALAAFDNLLKDKRDQLIANVERQIKGLCCYPHHTRSVPC